jgi:hypothetical protein
MASHPTVAFPLTLAEQLDAMLSGWLDHRDPSGARRRSGRIGRAVITVAEPAVPELETLCRRRDDLTLLRHVRHGGRWAVLVIEGDPLSVCGLTDVVALFRR